MPHGLADGPHATAEAGGGLRVDWARDSALRALSAAVHRRLACPGVAEDVAARVAIAALAVACCFGGLAPGCPKERTETLQRQAASDGSVPMLGDFMGGELLRSELRSGQCCAGCALSRHRALAFQAICDDDQQERLPRSTLESGECDGFAYAWNVVELGVGQRCVVDLMYNLGTLYPIQNDAAEIDIGSSAQRYLGRVSTPMSYTTLVSMASERLPRPCWFVNPWQVNRAPLGHLNLNGEYRSIFRSTYVRPDNHLDVAEKRIVCRDEKDPIELFEFVSKVSHACSLDHVNVLSCLGGWLDLSARPPELVLLTAWMPRGSLSKELQSGLMFEQSLKIGIGSARGLTYLHEMNVIHLSIKSPNILLNDNLEPLITDVGIACIRRSAGVAGASAPPSVVERWAAPELMKQHSIVDSKADVYSFGLVIWEIHYGHGLVPYHGVPEESSLLETKESEALPEMPQGAGHAALIHDCCRACPEFRPCMEQVLRKLCELGQEQPRMSAQTKTVPEQIIQRLESENVEMQEELHRREVVRQIDEEERYGWAAEMDDLRASEASARQSLMEERRIWTVEKNRMELELHQLHAALAASEQLAAHEDLDSSFAAAVLRSLRRPASPSNASLPRHDLAEMHRVVDTGAAATFEEDRYAVPMADDADLDAGEGWESVSPPESPTASPAAVARERFHASPASTPNSWAKAWCVLSSQERRLLGSGAEVRIATAMAALGYEGCEFQEFAENVVMLGEERMLQELDKAPGAATIRHKAALKKVFFLMVTRGWGRSSEQIPTHRRGGKASSRCSTATRATSRSSLLGLETFHSRSREVPREADIREIPMLLSRARSLSHLRPGSLAQTSLAVPLQRARSLVRLPQHSATPPRPPARVAWSDGAGMMSPLRPRGLQLRGC